MTSNAIIVAQTLYEHFSDLLFGLIGYETYTVIYVVFGEYC